MESGIPTGPLCKQETQPSTSWRPQASLRESRPPPVESRLLGSTGSETTLGNLSFCPYASFPDLCLGPGRRFGPYEGSSCLYSLSKGSQGAPFVEMRRLLLRKQDPQLRSQSSFQLLLWSALSANLCINITSQNSHSKPTRWVPSQLPFCR